MKRILKNVFFISALSLSSVVFSQIQLGAKAGVGLSNTTVIHGISKERIGGLAGLVAKYPLSYKNEDQYIQAELLYSNQGEYSMYQEGGQKYKAFINYINIPILYKYYFDNRGSDFFLEAGPQFGFKVSEKFDKDEPEITNNIPKSFDFAIAIGGGYSYERKYEINLRYNYGLIDTYDYNRWDNGKNRTSLLSLSLIYNFD